MLQRGGKFKRIRAGSAQDAADHHVTADTGSAKRMGLTQSQQSQQSFLVPRDVLSIASTAEIRRSGATTVSVRCLGRERCGLPERPRERQTEGGAAGSHENFFGRDADRRQISTSRGSETPAPPDARSLEPSHPLQDRGERDSFQMVVFFRIPAEGSAALDLLGGNTPWASFAARRRGRSQGRRDSSGGRAGGCAGYGSAWRSVRKSLLPCLPERTEAGLRRRGRRQR
jgi:hypothetical protein